MRSLVENWVPGTNYCSVTVSKIPYKNIFKEEGPIRAHSLPRVSFSNGREGMGQEEGRSSHLGIRVSQ